MLFECRRGARFSRPGPRPRAGGARVFRWLIVVGGLAVIVTASAGDLSPSLRLDQVQLLGSHNSYRPYPSPQAQLRLQTIDPQGWPALAYGNPPLESQLALGLHQLELDVAADPAGGLFAAPYAQGRAPSTMLAQMRAPGAKVLHIPGIDTASYCLSFRRCLAILAGWSRRHPQHEVIVVLVNAVDQDGEGAAWPHRSDFDRATLDALDLDIATVIGRDRVITPDEVRGRHATLRAAVLAHAWPTLASARGRFLFVLDGNPRHEALYRRGHPSLRRRMMFGWYGEDTAEAAVFKSDNPLKDGGRIRRLVSEGFIVRTRADEDGVEARQHDSRRLDAAIVSGAQWISTDFYPGVPDPEGLGYEADLGGTTMRCDAAAVGAATCPAYRGDISP